MYVWELLGLRCARRRSGPLQYISSTLALFSRSSLRKKGRRCSRILQLIRAWAQLTNTIFLDFFDRPLNLWMLPKLVWRNQKGSRLSTYSKHLQKLAQNYCRTTKLRKQNIFCMRKELKREIITWCKSHIMALVWCHWAWFLLASSNHWN